MPQADSRLIPKILNAENTIFTEVLSLLLIVSVPVISQ